MMTPEEFQKIRLELGVSTGGLAVALETGQSTIYRYEHDQRPIPPAIAIVMRLLQRYSVVRKSLGIERLAQHYPPDKPQGGRPPAEGGKRAAC